MSYCCDIPEASAVSAIWHGTGREHLCVRALSAYDHVVVSRNSSLAVLTETAGTQEEVDALQERGAGSA